MKQKGLYLFLIICLTFSAVSCNQTDPSMGSGQSDAVSLLENHVASLESENSDLEQSLSGITGLCFLF